MTNRAPSTLQSARTPRFPSPRTLSRHRLTSRPPAQTIWPSTLSPIEPALALSPRPATGPSRLTIPSPRVRLSTLAALGDLMRSQVRSGVNCLTQEGHRPECRGRLAGVLIALRTIVGRPGCLGAHHWRRIIRDLPQGALVQPVAAGGRRQGISGAQSGQHTSDDVGACPIVTGKVWRERREDCGCC